MKIYNVGFDLLYNKDYIKEKISENNNKRILEEQIDVDEMDIDNEDNGNHFQVGATNIADAYLEAQEYLEIVFGDDDAVEDFEITGVQLLELNVVNWPHSCNFCDADGKADEDVLQFDCVGKENKCKFHFRVTDGWDTLQCPECGYNVDRDNLIGSGGKYTIVNIKGNKEDKNEQNT